MSRPIDVAPFLPTTPPTRPIIRPTHPAIKPVSIPRKETTMDERTREPVKDHRRGHQPALQLGPASAGARHHGRGFRGACRLPPHASLSARPRTSGAGGVRPRRAVAVRRQQHPLRHLDQDRRMGARQAFALGAADPRLAIRSCGTSARPRCITSSIRRGSSRRTARPAWSACVAPSIRRSD